VVHSDNRLTTQTYAHVQEESLRRAVGVLDRIGLEGKVEEEADLLHSKPIEGILQI